MHEAPATNDRLGILASALCFLLLVLLILAARFMLGGHSTNDVMNESLFTAASQNATQQDWTVVTSTISRECLTIASDRATVKSAEGKVMLLYEGTPEMAHLRLISCGVKSGKRHTVYLNGQPVAQVKDDSYNTCICNSSGRPVTYTLTNPATVVNGWNFISITNDADVMDSWMGYGLQLVIAGKLSGAVIREFTFASSYDGSLRRAVYQLPMGYDPRMPVPLLVSIGGTGEDRWDALYHYAQQVNARGWLLVAPDVRQINKGSGGRTASLATQHDIMDAIHYMTETFHVDASRIYMSGFSAGGGVAATTAAKYPHIFAAVVDWIGPTDFLELIQQRPDLYWGLVTYDFGCPLEGGSSPCRFEWQRRAAREMVMNLKHVPMAIVHGRADDRVPFAQSEDFYNQMGKFYDPSAHNKLAVWHEGGHFDAVPALRPLDFMSNFTLNPNPQGIMIRTDESKDYYWVYIQQKDWYGKKADGFSNVMASYDLATRVISATIWDERTWGDGNLPLDVTFDLQAMSFDPDTIYDIEDHNLAMGSVVTRRGVRPAKGYLTISVPRDAWGKVHHRYLIYASSPSTDRLYFPLGSQPYH